MTRQTCERSDRWAIPSLKPGAIADAMSKPGHRVENVANDLPPYMSASLVWDVDEVLMLDVRSRRPDKSCAPAMRDLSDQLSELGWVQVAAGPLPHVREDGAMGAGLWVTMEVTP